MGAASRLRPTSSGSTGSPHGARTTATSAPARRAISSKRRPKRPFSTTTTRSPGSITLTTAASMPARLVPGTGNVARFLVAKTCRRRSCVSDMSAVNVGSN